jgi:hypothetical protein
MIKEPNIDLTRNPKQAEFFITSMAASQSKNPFKFLNYGGGIRGGKTFVVLAILVRLAEVFPGSRWHIIRKDMPSLEATTIPSFEKIIAGSNNWKSYRNKSNYHFRNKKGSKIFFKAENLSRDPSLTSFLGLETNGIFLEQSEELSIKIWEKALERVGSWYIPKMPRGLIFQTFNPCQNWVKDMVYEPWRKGELPNDTYFMSALPGDNPFVTNDQFTGWEKMADRYKKQFIEGDWTDYDGEEGRWLFAFSGKVNIGIVKWNPNEDTYLSFDFNRNPIACCVFQRYDNKIWGVESITLKDRTIQALSNMVKEKYPNAFFIVTGDASGSTLTTVSNLNNFDIIKSILGLAKSQMKYSGANPRLEASRMFVNSVFENYPVVLDKENCKELIFDCQNVKATSDNKILKDSRAKKDQQADCLDALRYFLHRFCKDVLNFYE